MSIVLSFLLPIILFLITLPIKATLKVAERAFEDAKSSATVKKEKGTSFNFYNKSNKVKKNSKRVEKVTEVLHKGGKVAIKSLIQTLKFLITALRSVASLLSVVLTSSTICVVLLVCFCLVGTITAVTTSSMFVEVEDSEGSSSGGSSQSSATGDLKSGWYWIGDSRTQGLAISMGWKNTTDSQNNWIYSVKVSEAQVTGAGSKTLAWFNDPAQDELRNDIYKLRDTNIIYNFGVNGELGSSAAYKAYFESLPAEFKSSNNIIFMSVTPVDEVMEAKFKYSVKNADIEKFNAEMKTICDELGMFFCDTYNAQGIAWAWGDGLHFTTECYKQIEAEARKQITEHFGSKKGTSATQEATTTDVSETGEEATSETSGD